jgi:hypothetical protein
MDMGILESMMGGASGRRRDRFERERRAIVEQLIDERRTEAQESLKLAREALSNGDSRTSQKYSRQGSLAARLAVAAEIDEVRARL